ncbi:MAG TPA: heme b synthase [Candidatus Hydrogenedentes bacterium]|nr:heme b synthase [Candidatus Hydrogenedentota bacterium]HPG67466.1 heme b synthase [Candidatus Hydrogenedentota bacterium]
MHHPEKRDDFAPRLIAWEITRRCNLHCKHCRAAAEADVYEGELTLDEIKRVVDNIAAHFKPIMILTGGEPLLRPDIFDIIRYTVGAGLRPVMATCGTLLTEAVARELKDAGIERISVSIDGPDAASHDDFRGVPGAFVSTMAGIEAARRGGLAFQVNTTVTRRNAAALDRIYDLAVSLGAVAFHPFLLVPTGRGKQLEAELLDADEYERVLNHIYDMRQASSLPFKPTCAPHYYRVLRQREAEFGRTVTAETHGLDAMSKGCMGGLSFAFISHVGRVQICGFLDVVAGDLREAGLDFAEIWRTSPLFNQLRDFRNYTGQCGICEYRRWCGGCRARAYAMTGDYLADEPFCAYVPKARRGV